MLFLAGFAPPVMAERILSPLSQVNGGPSAGQERQPYPGSKWILVLLFVELSIGRMLSQCLATVSVVWQLPNPCREPWQPFFFFL